LFPSVVTTMEDAGSKPRLRLITLAPLSAAKQMPLATSSSEPEPSASRTLTGSTLAAGATPATPTPLFVTAATVPETWVP
jgi:hypothetical protein